MPITVDGDVYAVSRDAGSLVNVCVTAGVWKIFKRKKSESDKDLELRVNSMLKELRKVRVLLHPLARLHPLTACVRRFLPRRKLPKR